MKKNQKVRAHTYISLLKKDLKTPIKYKYAIKSKGRKSMIKSCIS